MLRIEYLVLLTSLLSACADPVPDPGAADATPPADADAAVGDPSEFVFDESVIRTYDLTVAPSDWQWLQDNAELEEYVPATLEFEGATFDSVAIRYKGGYGNLYSCFDGQGNRTCKKLSIKLKFSEYDPDRRFYGLKRLNFHSMESDDSKMRDAIGYALYREAGVYAPRASYARVVVNGELLGLFALVEQIDGRFTRHRFPDGGEGNLYKEVWPEHLTAEPYLAALKTNEDENPSVDRMLRFAGELSQVSDETFIATMERFVDVDMLMRYMAVDRLIDNWDGIVAWYCFGPCSNHNYYWYESTAEDRLWLIPWDLDNTFEVPSPIRTFYGMPDWDDQSLGCDFVPIFWGLNGRPPACDPLIRRLATVTWDRYVAATEEILADQYRIEAMHARIDALAAHIADAVAEDPNGPTVVEWQAAVARLKDNIVSIRGYIENKIAGP